MGEHDLKIIMDFKTKAGLCWGGLLSLFMGQVGPANNAVVQCYITFGIVTQIKIYWKFYSFEDY